MPLPANLLLFFLRYGLRGMHLPSNNNKQTQTYNIIHDDVRCTKTSSRSYQESRYQEPSPYRIHSGRSRITLWGLEWFCDSSLTREQKNKVGFFLLQNFNKSKSPTQTPIKTFLQAIFAFLFVANAISSVYVHSTFDMNRIVTIGL